MPKKVHMVRKFGLGSRLPSAAAVSPAQRRQRRGNRHRSAKGGVPCVTVTATEIVAAAKRRRSPTSEGARLATVQAGTYRLQGQLPGLPLVIPQLEPLVARDRSLALAVATGRQSQ